MSKNNNNREEKKLSIHAHNRKAGMAKFWKHFSNRRGRRRFKRLNFWMVQGKVEIR